MQNDSYHSGKVPISAPETARASTINEDLQSVKIKQVQAVRPNDIRRSILQNMPCVGQKSSFGQEMLGRDLRGSNPKKWMIQAQMMPSRRPINTAYT